MQLSSRVSPAVDHPLAKREVPLVLLVENGDAGAVNRVLYASQVGGDSANQRARQYTGYGSVQDALSAIVQIQATQPSEAAQSWALLKSDEPEFEVYATPLGTLHAGERAGRGTMDVARKDAASFGHGFVVDEIRLDTSVVGVVDRFGDLKSF